MTIIRFSALTFNFFPTVSLDCTAYTSVYLMQVSGSHTHTHTHTHAHTHCYSLFYSLLDVRFHFSTGNSSFTCTFVILSAINIFVVLCIVLRNLHTIVYSILTSASHPFCRVTFPSCTLLFSFFMRHPRVWIYHYQNLLIHGTITPSRIPNVMVIIKAAR